MSRILTPIPGTFLGAINEEDSEFGSDTPQNQTTPSPSSATTPPSIFVILRMLVTPGTGVATATVANVVLPNTPASIPQPQTEPSAALTASAASSVPIMNDTPVRV